MRLGYARVSSDTQDYTAQIEALRAAGCERIFSEKASGKSTNGRPELARLLKALASGDVMVVTKLDRVARSIRDLLAILDTIKAEGAGFQALQDTWIDTTTPQGELILGVMGCLSEFERKLINERCKAGIARAKAKGKRFGRPTTLDTSQRSRIAQRYSEGETIAALARDYSVGDATIWRVLHSR